MTNRKIVRVRGLVTSSPVKVGTGSEHTAAVLTTNKGEKLILVRVGGNPFGDKQTQELVGKEIEVEGYRLGTEIRYISAHEV